MRTGILGGTFDPIHDGHLAIADAACAMLDLARVLVIPSHHPPHRPVEPRVSGYHRFTMAALAVFARSSAGGTGRPVPFFVSDLELVASGRSYTAVTLRTLQAEGHRPSELFFITGADAFAEIATWRDYPDIFDLSHFAVVSRPGHPAQEMPALLPALASRMVMAHIEGGEKELVMRHVTDGQPADVYQGRPAIWLLDYPTPDVSSTEIRRRLRNHESIEGMVPEIVEAYIRRYGLYGAGAQAVSGDR